MALRDVLIRLARRLPEPRVIYDRQGGSPYLSRYYLTSQQGDVDPELFDARVEVPKQIPRLFLHRFHRSDDDGALHSHPWAWAVSLVLVGGYSEERRIGEDVVRRTIKPWSFNFLSGDSYHRVDLIEEDAWSLFLVGPSRGQWYFWSRESKLRCRWREYILALRNGALESAPWEPS